MINRADFDWPDIPRNILDIVMDRVAAPPPLPDWATTTTIHYQSIASSSDLLAACRSSTVRAKAVGPGGLETGLQQLRTIFGTLPEGSAVLDVPNSGLFRQTLTNGPGWPAELSSIITKGPRLTPNSARGVPVPGRLRVVVSRRRCVLRVRHVSLPLRVLVWRVRVLRLLACRGCHGDKSRQFRTLLSFL